MQSILITLAKFLALFVDVVFSAIMVVFAGTMLIFTQIVAFFVFIIQIPFKALSIGIELLALSFK